MFCTKCGASLVEDAKFCPHCGTPAGAAPAPTPVAEPKRYHYAGFWIRFLAYLIDQLVISVVGFVFMLIGLVMTFGGITSFEQFEDPDPALIVGLVGSWVVFGIVYGIAQWLYFAFMESSASRGTLGKMALGLQVIDYKGETITFGRATGRYFGKILSSLVLMIGYIMAGFTARKQALHDLLADTYVVRQRDDGYSA